MTKITKLSQLFAALEAGEQVEWNDPCNNSEWESVLWEDNWIINVSIVKALVESGCYRIAPKTISITGPGGTFSYPEPVREFDQVAAAPVFYFIEFKHPEGWICDEVNLKYNEHSIRRLLQRNLIHLTESAVKAHAEALILAQGGALE